MTAVLNILSFPTPAPVAEPVRPLAVLVAVTLQPRRLVKREAGVIKVAADAIPAIARHYDLEPVTVGAGGNISGIFVVKTKAR